MQIQPVAVVAVYPWTMCFTYLSLTGRLIGLLDNVLINWWLIKCNHEDALCIVTCTLTLFESGMQPLCWIHNALESSRRIRQPHNWLGSELRHQRQSQTKPRTATPWWQIPINTLVTVCCLRGLCKQSHQRRRASVLQTHRWPDLLPSGPICCLVARRASKNACLWPDWPGGWKSPSGQRASGQCHALCRLMNLVSLWSVFCQSPPRDICMTVCVRRLCHLVWSLIHLQCKAWTVWICHMRYSIFMLALKKCVYCKQLLSVQWTQSDRLSCCANYTDQLIIQVVVRRLPMALCKAACLRI